MNQRDESDVLPQFDKKGLLPVGDYALTIEQLLASHLVTGTGNPSATWDSQWRKQLVINLDQLVHQLNLVGIRDIFVDGSFVENKDHPNDIDGYFEVDTKYFASGEFQRDINAIDPFRVWTWDRADRQPDPNSAKMQLPMWHRYRVELYPHCTGILSGIVDEFGNNLTFPAAFRKSRQHHSPKGIVKIIGPEL